MVWFESGGNLGRLTRTNAFALRDTRWWSDYGLGLNVVVRSWELGHNRRSHNQRSARKNSEGEFETIGPKIWTGKELCLSTRQWPKGHGQVYHREYKTYSMGCTISRYVHLWFELAKTMSYRKPSSKKELVKVLKEEWETIGESVCWANAKTNFRPHCIEGRCHKVLAVILCVIILMSLFLRFFN